MNQTDAATNSYPSDWPEHCPPADAIPASGNYFRVGKKDQPDEDEFKSMAELNRALDADNCQRRGLSLVRTLADARHQKRMFQRLGSKIYRGELSAEHGHTKPTKGKSPSHTTWWPFAGVLRATLFSVVEG